MSSRQTYRVAAVLAVTSTLAEGGGVLLEETCARCDAELHGAIVCEKCRLHFCAKVCYGQHVDDNPEHV